LGNVAELLPKLKWFKTAREQMRYEAIEPFMLKPVTPAGPSTRHEVLDTE